MLEEAAALRRDAARVSTRPVHEVALLAPVLWWIRAALA